MKKTFEVPNGKNFVGLSLNGHTFARLLDSNGLEVFRFDSAGEYITAVVQPGTFTIETDGQLLSMDLIASERLMHVGETNALRAPQVTPLSVQ